MSIPYKVLCDDPYIFQALPLEYDTIALIKCTSTHYLLCAFYSSFY